MIKIHIFLSIVGLLFLDASAMAQVGRAGVGGFPGSVGGISGVRGAQQGFSARSVNPNFNPRGSLSTFQNLNPRGSLSPALNLNPQGSLLRPRTSGVTGFNNGSVATSARVTAYRIPFAPNYSQLRILPRPSISSWAKISLQQFESSLSEYKNAEAWRTYLDLDKIKSRLETATDQPLDEPSREQLADMLERFATVATETKYKKIKLLPGFRATWTSLRELLRADSGDQRERLMRSANALNKELKDRKGGKAWQEFLVLTELIEADVASDPDSPTAFRAACEKTNARFAKITATGGEYRRITDLTEFQATVENLKSLLQKMLEPQPSPSAE
jgi:hypothetical protein